MTYHIPIPEERSGLELDEFLCLQFPLFNKGFVRRQIREGRVLLDGQPCRPSQRVRVNQVLFVEFDEEEAPIAPVAPEARELAVLHEDAAVLAVEKPAGLAVEPERWQRDAASVAGALLEMARSRSAGDETLDLRLRAVHRIDKDTTGVLLVAKTLEAERGLRTAFESEGAVVKEYLALVEGEYPDAGESEDGEPAWDRIDLPLGPDDRRSGRMRVRKDGKASRTDVRVEERFRGLTLMRCRPLTGRTHQIRVHLAEQGFPLLIDPLYGRRNAAYLSEFKRGYRPKRGRPEPALMDRLSLHAARITFPNQDPSRGRVQVTVESPLPRDFVRLLKQLGKVRPFHH